MTARKQARDGSRPPEMARGHVLGYWRRVARARRELLRDTLQSLRDLL